MSPMPEQSKLVEALCWEIDSLMRDPSRRDDAWESNLGKTLANARTLLPELAREVERLREFAFGDRLEWEQANATLKHQARELARRLEQAEQREAELRQRWHLTEAHLMDVQREHDEVR